MAISTYCFAESAAAADPYGLQSAATSAGLQTGAGDLPTLIGSIIKYALQLVGIILVVLFLYGGFIWMTAQGDPKKIEKAQGIIKDGIIGLVLVVASYSIANFIITRLGSL